VADHRATDPHLVVAAEAGNEPEAAMILGLLKGAGIKAMTKPGTGGGGLGWSAGRQRAIYVRAGDLDRAHQALGQHPHSPHPADPDPVPNPKRRFGFLRKGG
jgi:Putative prokaryotic signal transducing protein